ncbi:hypothetical protein GTZ99_10050 [Novosphingobium sp. FSY-8]|uniref:Capsular polysaccharide transport system permease protein n=1 Tax=Novosphingobium ovatum TaxID=1908523 RepID=A0ABW9XED3_9SPHN|nr:hypothetical protein [Novosphingobium ovatum]
MATVYYGALAGDVYVSESRFVLRMPERQAPTALGLLLKGGVASAGDEAGAAQSVVLSRDGLMALNGGGDPVRGAFAAAYTARDVAWVDRFNVLNLDPGFEGLYRYFRRKVQVAYAPGTTISVLTVRAYAPDVAQAFNARLLGLAESTVNRLNARARDDLMRQAEGEVQDARQRAEAAGRALAAYRNQTGVVDPDRQATVQMQMVGKLQDELIATKATLREMARVAPENPQIGALQARAAELQVQIGAQGAAMAGGQRSLAGRAERYSQLLLASQIADKQLTAAFASLEEARSEARRKQVYIERIVEPNRPDRAEEPRRLRGILTVLIAGLVLHGIATMLLAGLREHHD